MSDRSNWKPGLTHIGSQKQLFLDDHRVERHFEVAIALFPSAERSDRKGTSVSAR